jgi:4a-hydroxytetrahydrobiopterin dehydratase
VSRPARIGAAAALARLPGWSAVDGRDAIAKTFRFPDFNTTFGWMARVALMAEKLDHHPEWFNVYNRVDVVLATHDANGVTELDVTLAQAMEEFARAGR